MLSFLWLAGQTSKIGAEHGGVMLALKDRYKIPEGPGVGMDSQSGDNDEAWAEGH